jgi:hypothetical protein
LTEQSVSLIGEGAQAGDVERARVVVDDEPRHRRVEGLGALGQRRQRQPDRRLAEVVDRAADRAADVGEDRHCALPEP